jgi:hypothetical protein
MILTCQGLFGVQKRCDRQGNGDNFKIEEKKAEVLGVPAVMVQKGVTFDPSPSPPLISDKVIGSSATRHFLSTGPCRECGFPLLALSIAAQRETSLEARHPMRTFDLPVHDVGDRASASRVTEQVRSEDLDTRRRLYIPTNFLALQHHGATQSRLTVHMHGVIRLSTDCVCYAITARIGSLDADVILAVS